MEKDINSISSEELKQQAWGILLTKKKKSILFTLFFFLLTFALCILFDEELWGYDESMGSNYDIAVILFNLAFYLAFSPLVVGFYKFFLQMSRGCTEKFSVLLSGFKKYIRNMLAIIMADVIYYGLLVVLGIIFFIFVYVSAEGLDSLHIQSKFLESGLYSFWMAILLAIALALFFFLIFKTFALIEFLPFVLADNNNMGAFKLIRSFWKRTSPYNYKMIKLWFSFILWWVLCVITLGIALLWVLPYWTLTKAEFYKRLFKEYSPIDVMEDISIETSNN